MRRRSSNWLQKGCRTVIPVLRLGIHPEMERPAILKRSMPSTAGVTIGIPPARVGNEADFQLQEEYTRRGAVSPGTFVPVLMSEGKCLHWRAKSAHLGGHLPVTAVDDLLTKFRRVGVSLAEFAGVKTYRGMLTGRNEAFLIDTPTKNRLIRDDPRSAEIIKPCIRGQNIKRWTPKWAGLWLIILKSSGDYSWPWSDAPDTARAEDIFQRTFPSIHRHLKPLEEKLRNRQDKGHYWWELRTCSYYTVFESPKIITQDLATYSWFGFDDQGLYPINTCYIWPIADLYVLGWLCSPTAWWICHRLLQHGINDTLRMFGEQVKTLPIAPPTDSIRAEVELIVVRLIEITQATQKTQQLVLDWLRTEYDVQE